MLHDAFKNREDLKGNCLLSVDYCFHLSVDNSNVDNEETMSGYAIHVHCNTGYIVDDNSGELTSSYWVNCLTNAEWSDIHNCTRK